MKWGVSCFSHAKNIRTSSRGNDDLCARIPIPSLLWRDQLRSPSFCGFAVRWRQTVLADIFFGSFSRVRNDSSQGASRQGEREQAVIHQIGVAWWENRREKDRSTRGPQIWSAASSAVQVQFKCSQSIVTAVTYALNFCVCTLYQRHASCHSIDLV